MQTAGKTVEAFYDAVRARDIAAARTYLDPNLTFYGLFETYRSADAYLAALTGLLSITASLEVKTIVAEGEHAALFFDLTTTAPAAAQTLVAEWHTVRHGKITQVRSAFDGRPFAAMFGAPGGGTDASDPAETHQQSEHEMRALKDTFVTALINHPVVSHDEWLEARRALLEEEKAFTRQCDDMSRLQRGLPWERVTKAYVFDGPDGRQSLADLFGGCSQERGRTRPFLGPTTRRVRSIARPTSDAALGRWFPSGQGS